MEPNQQELQALGRRVAAAFKELIETPCTDGKVEGLPSRRQIATEEERFRLWARTIGLYQTGHASLDYRVRYASYIESSLRNLLAELQDHLKNRQSLDSRNPLCSSKTDVSSAGNRMGDKIAART